MPFSLSEVNKQVTAARLGFNSTLDRAGEKSGVFKPKPAPPPPASGASSAGFGAKVDGARKAFNSTIDRAGEKTGAFKHRSEPRTAGSAAAPFAGAPAPPPPPPRRNGPPPPPARGARPPVPSAKTHQSITLPGNGSAFTPPPPPYEAAASHDDGESAASARARWQTREVSSSESVPQTSLGRPPAASKPSWQRPASTLSATPPLAASHTNGAQGTLPYPRFSEFTVADKHNFFSLLDEFFSRRDGPTTSSAPSPEAIAETKARPPPVSLSTRPSASSSTLSLPSQERHVPIPTPQATTESDAAVLVSYLASYRTWSASEAWYTSSTSPYPPPLAAHESSRRRAGWSQSGDERVTSGWVLFSDLSQVWWRVVSSASRPYPCRRVDVRWRPLPEPQATEALERGNELYGEHVAWYAEDKEYHQQHAGRGECWDLAAEALKSYPYAPKPLGSIGRTHGALIYRGKAWGKGQGEGYWKGGDVGNVRKGDIVEWREVACETVRPRGLCTLGDPEHTAIVVAPTAARLPDPADAPPALVGELTVVEQSLRELPTRRTYDLATMSRGEVWIYRPMPEDELVGPTGEEEVGSWPPPGPTFAA